MVQFSRTDFKIILQIIANILRMFGIVMIFPGILALLFFEGEYFWVFFLPGAIVTGIFWWIKSFLKFDQATMKHAITGLVLSWLIISLISSIPFAKYNIAFLDALFESVSGWTGTGFTMIQDPSAIPKILNIWRALIQWVGGFGIVILALLIYEKPKTAQTLFLAEGRREDLALNILKIARLFVVIYTAYTLIGSFVMWSSNLFGSEISYFDSLINVATAIATGGYSSNPVGVGIYGRFPSSIIMIMMLIGGISFIRHYELFKGKFRSVFKDSEVRFLLATIVLASLLISADLYLGIKSDEFSNSEFNESSQVQMFDGVFYVVSAVVGSGHTTQAPVSNLPNLSMLIIILLMIFGASYGSTCGAIKIWRILIIFKVVKREIRRAFVPKHAILPLKVGDVTISDDSALQAASFTLLYITLLIAGTIIFLMFGYGSLESIFTVASAQGNVGLNVIQTANYFSMHPVLKIVMMGHMLLGRMEIIPILIFVRGFLGRRK